MQPPTASQVTDARVSKGTTSLILSRNEDSTFDHGSHGQNRSNEYPPNPFVLPETGKRINSVERGRRVGVDESNEYILEHSLGPTPIETQQIVMEDQSYLQNISRNRIANHT